MQSFSAYVCPTGKITYSTHAATIFAMKQIRKKHNRYKRRYAPMTAYRCSECKYWHIATEHKIHV